MIPIKKKGRVDLHEQASELAKKYNILNSSGDVEEGYQMVISQLQFQGVQVDYLKMNQSLSKLKSAGASDALIENRYQEGIRQGLITTYEGALPPGAKCRLLGTDALVPREEHAVLEGDIFDCQYLLTEIVSDWGCHHSYEIL